LPSIRNFAARFDVDLLDIDLWITPAHLEGAIVEPQMFERFLLRNRREILQQRQIVDPPVAHAQCSVAGRAWKSGTRGSGQNVRDLSAQLAHRCRTNRDFLRSRQTRF
jgi:hypothetical protein